MAKKERLEGEFVSKSEFDSFKSEQTDNFNAVLNKLDKIVSPSIEPNLHETPAVETGAALNNFSGEYLPPQYKQIFEKYFDPADGFTARLTFPDIDDKGRESGGITFTIFVPLKFSNTDDAYRKMYKQDLRTRALQPHNIGKGIEDYCRIVARNLKYNRTIKTK